jgi:putative pyruvate formate lyase activating enzyme
VVNSALAANTFLIRSTEFEPAYLSLCRSGDLQPRATAAVKRLRHCLLCPRNCGVDRFANKTAACRTGRYAQVSTYFPHFGEESCLRGWRGSGTIFFSMCNLRCVFCQNYGISQAQRGSETLPDRLAGMMLELQAAGCHNINFVTPEHVVAQVIEAVAIAAEQGLRAPLVYNTSAYDSLESLQLLDGIIDIYLPDFKFCDSTLSLRYVKSKDYPEVARRCLLEMHRQTGVLKCDEQGLAKRGVLVRHLVMPGEIAGTEAIMQFLANEVSRDTYLNVMSQYRPAGRVSAEEFREINRRVSTAEYERALEAARRAGLWRIEAERPLQ